MDDVKKINQVSSFAVVGLVFAVAVASLWGVIGWKAVQERQIALVQNGEDARNLVHSLAQHASKTFGGVKIALLGAKEHIQSGQRYGLRGAELDDLLATYAQLIPQVREIGVLDASGKFIHSSFGTVPSINTADREYFQYHKTNLDESARISDPLISRLNGRPTLLLSQRLSNLDGTFAGVIFASLDLQYFRTFYRTFEAGSNSSVTLMKGDGKVLVHRQDSDVGKDLSQTALFTVQLKRSETGLYRILSPFDGLTKQFAYERLLDYPIVISVATPEAEILDTWRKGRDQDFLIAAAISAVFVVLGVVLVRQMRSRQRAEILLHAANDQLKALSETDALTGIPNRRRFDEIFEQERRRALRSQSSLAVLFIDVDFFKAYNDTYGHAEGDICLRRVAQALAANLRRAGDAVARYGGEEFAVILPDTSLPDAITVAENLRRAVNALGTGHEGSAKGTVSVSIGVAAGLPGIETDGHELLQAADTALYLAKEAGRDRVSTLPSPQFRPRLLKI